MIDDHIHVGSAWQATDRFAHLEGRLIQDTRLGGGTTERVIVLGFAQCQTLVHNHCHVSFDPALDSSYSLVVDGISWW